MRKQLLVRSPPADMPALGAQRGGANPGEKVRTWRWPGSTAGGGHVSKQLRQGVGQGRDLGWCQMVEQNLSRSIYLDWVSRAEGFATGGGCNGDASSCIGEASRLLDQSAMFQLRDHTGGARRRHSAGASQIVHAQPCVASLTEHQQDRELGEGQPCCSNQIIFEQPRESSCQSHQGAPELSLGVFEVAHTITLSGASSCFHNQLTRTLGSALAAKRWEVAKQVRVTKTTIGDATESTCPHDLGFMDPRINRPPPHPIVR